MIYFIFLQNLLGIDDFAAIFTGLMKTTEVCQGCLHQNVQFESFTNLNVPMDADSLADCVAIMLSERQHDQRCSSCHSRKTTKAEVVVLPPLLIIQLPRTHFCRSEMTFKKDTKAIRPSFELRIGETKLKLKAVANHHGSSAMAGHYTGKFGNKTHYWKNFGN